MRSILFIVCIIISFSNCSKSNEKTDIINSVFTDSTNLKTEGSNQKQNLDIVSQETKEEKQRKAEERKILENISIPEIIDLYIERGYKQSKSIMIYIGDFDQNNHAGYFEFISHDKIKWYRASGGFKFYPYIYIINDTNIRIEIFYYNIGYGHDIARSISTGKYYINISKENLIEYYLGNLNFIKDYSMVNNFNTNRYEPEELTFKTHTGTDVYTDCSLRDEKIGKILKDSEAEVIDMFYNSLNDDFPLSVHIKNKNITGWINVNHIDFVKRETKEIVNGIFLYNSIKGVINRYGPRIVTGKTTGNSIPVRDLPANNSPQLHLLQDGTEVKIDDVSTNLEMINGIEATWYKVYKFVENYTKDMEPADYEIIGWVFGANLKIDNYIDYD